MSRFSRKHRDSGSSRKTASASANAAKKWRNCSKKFEARSASAIAPRLKCGSVQSLAYRLARSLAHSDHRLHDALGIRRRRTPRRNLQVRKSRDFHVLAWPDFPCDLLLAQAVHGGDAQLEP